MKVKEGYEMMVKGVSEFLNSNKWKEFLKFQSHFYNYSFGNTVMIFMQKENATYVAGFKTWNKLGRYIKKGEKAIKILAPVKVKVKEEKKNKENEEKKGREEQKERYVLKGFKVVNVFDISQTEGKDVPEICRELKGKSVKIETLYNKLLSIIKIPVIREPLRGPKGYYDPLKNIISIKEDMDPKQKLKTLVHEYAHYKLHSKKTDFTRAEQEVQAEGIAFIVLNHFGIDTSSYSFEYITTYSYKEPQILLKHGLIMQKTAEEIINEIKSLG
jgi:antirestriction protein ArdC